MKKNKSGFTLIELLVVIAIIGLLSTISVLALNTARARARDAKRIAAVKQMQTALEMYFNDNNTYPVATAVNKVGSLSNGSTTYMAIIPKPPKPNDNTGTCGTTLAPNYTYAVDAANSSYTIQYCLGSATGGIPAGKHVATPAGINDGTY